MPECENCKALAERVRVVEEKVQEWERFFYDQAFDDYRKDAPAYLAAPPSARAGEEFARDTLRFPAPPAAQRYEYILGGERELWEIADSGKCEGDCNPRCDSCRAGAALNEAGDMLRGELALIKAKPAPPSAPADGSGCKHEWEERGHMQNTLHMQCRLCGAIQHDKPAPATRECNCGAAASLKGVDDTNTCQICGGHVVGLARYYPDCKPAPPAPPAPPSAPAGKGERDG